MLFETLPVYTEIQCCMSALCLCGNFSDNVVNMIVEADAFNLEVVNWTEEGNGSYIQDGFGSIFPPSGQRVLPPWEYFG
jgi:hypothetical protein